MADNGNSAKAGCATKCIDRKSPEVKTPSMAQLKKLANVKVRSNKMSQG
jgi:hypothetical protein